MALYSTLRRSAARITPVASRLIAGQRTHHSRTPALYSAVQSQLSDSLIVSTSLFPLRRYSSAASCSSKSAGSDWKQVELIESIIDSIIDSVEDGQDNREDVSDIEPPEWFPFEIEDIPGIKSITLLRKYQGESIRVKVDLNKNKERPRSSTMSLLVMVAKSGNYKLLFDCTAVPNELHINSLTITVKKRDRSQDDNEARKNHRYVFRDLGLYKMDKALHEFLKERGIEIDIGYFLCEYMIRKSSREYLKWLQTLKKFVQT